MKWLKTKKSINLVTHNAISMSKTASTYLSLTSSYAYYDCEILKKIYY